MNVKKIKTTHLFYKIIYTVLCCALGWYLHGKLTPDYSAMMQHNEPPYVLVKEVQTADISPKKKYIAQVEPINSVDIMPQVSGYLEEILFKDGSFINKDDNIFIIEQRRYQADLLSAKASVKQLQNEFNRINELHKSRYASDKDKDLAQSRLEQAQAALDLAQLNLEHTEIKSPISGYIGKALVTVGNLVSPNTQKLARVVQMQPIRIAFSVTDKERFDFMNKAQESKDVFIDIVLPNGKVETITVQNLFFDNEVNPETATIPVYIEAANTENLLIPGNYVDIYFRFNSGKQALLLPQVALAADVNGSYVMTVNEQNVVQQKYVQLGEVIDDKQVVLSGLQKGDKVIVQGLQKVKDGMQVNSNLILDTDK